MGTLLTKLNYFWPILCIILEMADVETPKFFQVAEIIIFLRLLKNAPACAETSAGRQMQVEPCEIPPHLRERPKS
jgi:hypothetical protein